MTVGEGAEGVDIHWPCQPWLTGIVGIVLQACRGMRRSIRVGCRQGGLGSADGRVGCRTISTAVGWKWSDRCCGIVPIQSNGPLELTQKCRITS